mmetsp:Transcript_3228/g.4923  ORF Transcript_3228/g.4923 Transcript_3228/m.4923 type:complete len:551 (+) Transcript_3228:939-2591(+)
MAMSFCGHMMPHSAGMDRPISERPDLAQIFDANRITPQQLSNDPFMINDPKMMFKLSDRVYPWSIVGPCLAYWCAFGEPPPQAMIDRLMPKVSSSSAQAMGVAKKESTEASSAAGAQSWSSWWWGRSSKKPIVKDDVTQTPSSSSSSSKQLTVPIISTSGPALNSMSMALTSNTTSTTTTTLTTTTTGPLNSLTLTESTTVDDSSTTLSAIPIPLRWERKSIRPNPAQLASLGLQQGANTITFTVTSQLQGTQTVSASLYLWPWHSRIIISDVDGTITRSDVLGHVLPLVGRDWSHPGVSSLYSNIMDNGYKFMYLTSRAIGQASLTRGYLQTLRQGSAALPAGPIIMSPDRLFESLTREVIRRKPEEFKIAALRDIRSLFPESHDPFYAGFGNRSTDVISYRAVGVPEGKIFVINAAGEIHSYNNTYIKSYNTLNTIYNEMFPVVTSPSGSENEAFNDFLYWHPPPPTISDIDEEPAPSSSTSLSLFSANPSSAKKSSSDFSSSSTSTKRGGTTEAAVMSSSGMTKKSDTLATSGVKKKEDASGSAKKK